MPRESRQWQFRVQDALNAIERINDYVGGLTFEQFALDHRTLDAVERNFISIGEAARGIPDTITQQFPEVPWGDMRAIRNFVTHVYWGVDPKRVWETIQVDLPPLVAQLEAVLAKTRDTTGNS